MAVWVAIKEEEERIKVTGEQAAKRKQTEADARRAEMRTEAGLGGSK